MKTVSITDYTPLPSEEQQYSLKFMENRGVILLECKESENPIVGICNPDEMNREVRELRNELKDYHKSDVDFVLIDYEEFTAWLTGCISDTGEFLSTNIFTEKIEIDKLTDHAPVINLVNSILIEAIRRKASDIHIEGMTEKARVRYRIDGVLLEAAEYPAGLFASIASRIKIMANLNIMEKRLPQDGRLSVNIGKVSLDMRISIIPVSTGESIVLRLFNRQDALLTLEELGFSIPVLSRIKRLCKMPHGLLLFTGPTGSGKTTSLNAIINRMDCDSEKIISIEDPVEYSIPSISQIPVNEEIGLTFSTLLRRVLRQDPDIIMIGEIRDPDTAQLAVRAALTGHLVLSSLHTNDAASSIQRLVNMGVEPYLLAAVLRGVTAQRLVRLLCPACKKKRALSLAELKLYETYDLSPSFTYEKGGCAKCNGTGYWRRTTLSECFLKSERLERLIVNRSPISEISSCLKDEGFTSLFQDGLLKTISGTTDIKEVERVL
ncbi:MAG: type II/IV secretion system protein [Spirochaetales bacterium]|nr:type II/IV secretion system protein [Spirochaetales bacterium]